MMYKFPLQSSTEEIKYFPYPFLGNSLVLDVKNSLKLWRLWHEKYCIGFVDETNHGYGENTYRGKRYISSAKCVFAAEPGELQRMERVSGPGIYKVIFLDDRIVEEALQTLGYHGSTHFSSFNYNDNELYSLMRRMLQHDEIASTRLEIESYCASFMEKAFSRLTEKKLVLKDDFCNAKVKKVKEYILNHFEENISLDELSIESNLSKFTLIRAFKKIYGITPHQYHLRVCIAKTREFLAKNEKTSLLCFTDQSHFIKVFKEIVGVTPEQYRQQANSIRYYF